MKVSAVIITCNEAHNLRKTLNQLYWCDEIVVVDAIQKSPVEFILLMDHRSVNATVVDCDASGKKISVEVDGEIYEVEIMDELDQMLDVMGFGIAATKQIKEIKAPMPGMVLEIAVTDGQEVAEGEKVLHLFAESYKDRQIELPEARRSL